MRSWTALRGCRGCASLYLSRSHVTDDGMKHLAGLRMLQKLDLFDTQIGDAGLANLSGYRLATALAPGPSPERRGEIIALTPRALSRRERGGRVDHAHATRAWEYEGQ